MLIGELSLFWGIIMKYLIGKKRGNLKVFVKLGRKFGFISFGNFKVWFLVYLNDLYLFFGGLSVVFVLVYC